MNLLPVITWLENGCDPKEAAKELRIYQATLEKLEGWPAEARLEAALDDLIAERDRLREVLQRIADHHEEQRAAWSDESGDADQSEYHEERRNFALFHLTPNTAATATTDQKRL